MLDKRGDIFIEGLDVIIRRDLNKHKSLLEVNILNIHSLQATRASEIDRKRFYGEQKGKRRYRDDEMDKAIEQMNKNIAHLSIKIKFTKDQRDQNTIIVDTLTEQLNGYELGLRAMARRKINKDANSN